MKEKISYLKGCLTRSKNTYAIKLERLNRITFISRFHLGKKVTERDNALDDMCQIERDILALMNVLLKWFVAQTMYAKDDFNNYEQFIYLVKAYMSHL